ncbi:MAG: enoyl-CoA hydratase-related protein [Myxococcota bacterium]
MGQDSVVKIDIERGVLTATLADHENRNALGAQLVGELRAAIVQGNNDDSVRAIVVTNEGSTFCAGANLKERSSGAGPKKDSGGIVELFQEIQASPTPVLGRVDGHVVGGGNGLVAVFDVSIASEKAKFGFTEVRLGVAPAMISVVCLPKMRHGDAMEAFLRGNRFSAERAAELGLINRAVAHEDLSAAMEEVLDDLRLAGPKALGEAKRLIYEVNRLDQDEAFKWTTQVSNELFASEEASEGMKAFLEKRAPAWAEIEGESE